ncbi:MAG: hypothetical protein OEN02_19775 [Gammaproteobacteria bacterium]|nr:hypothetical protein [Gammaproteobacteria bacterium]
MQCYQYLAAITAVSSTIETLPGCRHKLPHCVITDWMEENGIEPDDVLLVSGDEVRAIVESLIVDSQPQIPHAA